MQQQLFETHQKPKLQSLIISGSGKKVLTKNQQAFNKLTQKIEKLHKEIEKKQLQLDLALKVYGNEIHPLEKQVTEHKRQMITVLWDLYKSRKLSKTDQRNLKHILQDHVQELCTEMEDGPDEALKKIYAELEGESYESVLQREKELMKTEMQEMFEDMDVDIDLKGMDMDDEKSMAEKLAQIQQKMMERAEQQEEQEQFHRRSKKKKKTAKQEDNERMRQAVDEMKQKNISTIYKQLAKLFHPDLEHDEERRAEKEILMKELTAAYEAKNLHTLLTLELKWIHKETDHLESLTDEKLAIYLEILKEQARELEREKYTICHQPRYGVLVQVFGYPVQNSPLETVKQHLGELQKILRVFKRDIEIYQTDNGFRHIKDMIKEWKEMQRNHNEEEELLNMIFRKTF